MAICLTNAIKYFLSTRLLILQNIYVLYTYTQNLQYKYIICFYTQSKKKKKYRRTLYNLIWKREPHPYELNKTRIASHHTVSSRVVCRIRPASNWLEKTVNCHVPCARGGKYTIVIKSCLFGK